MLATNNSSSFHNFYRGKKVLVTGATGFKGSWLCAWLHSLGAEVYGLSLDVPTQPSLFEQLELDQKIKHSFVDIRDFERTFHTIQNSKAEMVFHLAAQSLVLESYQNPLSTWDTNVMGTLNVMEAVRRCDDTHSLLVITSDKCYENVNWNYGYRENDKLGGHDPYSSSKAACEIAFSSFFRSFFATESKKIALSARAGNVIGGGDWAENRIVPDCMRAWQKSENVELRHPSAVRPWQHVLESLSGYLHIVQSAQSTPEINGESYNVGPSQETYQSVKRLVSTLQETWPESSYTALLTPPQNFKEAQLLTLSCEKIFQQLQWQANLNFQESVHMTGHWYWRQRQGEKAWALCMEQIKQFETLAQERKRTWA